MDWYIEIDGQSMGPFSTEEVLGKLNSGELKPNNLAYNKGLQDWTEISKIPELSQPTTKQKPNNIESNMSGQQPPEEIQSIGQMHFIGGILTTIGMFIMTAIYAVSGLLGALFVIGAIVWCFMPFSIFSAVVGIMEILNGSKHKKHFQNPESAPIKNPKTLAILQIIAGVLSFNLIQLIMGILVLSKANKPEVVAYYESRSPQSWHEHEGGSSGPSFLNIIQIRLS